MSYEFYGVNKIQILCTDIFLGILYPARLPHVVPYLFHDRARHRHDALIPVRDIMASRTYRVSNISHRELHARTHLDIPYQHG